MLPISARQHVHFQAQRLNCATEMIRAIETTSAIGALLLGLQLPANTNSSDRKRRETARCVSAGAADRPGEGVAAGHSAEHARRPREPTNGAHRGRRGRPETRHHRGAANFRRSHRRPPDESAGPAGCSGRLAPPAAHTGSSTSNRNRVHAHAYKRASVHQRAPKAPVTGRFFLSGEKTRNRSNEVFPTEVFWDHIYLHCTLMMSQPLIKPVNV